MSLNVLRGRRISSGTVHVHDPLTITDELQSLLFCHVTSPDTSELIVLMLVAALRRWVSCKGLDYRPP